VSTWGAVAALSAGAVVWLLLPGAGLHRLAAKITVQLPPWVTPAPQAMNIKTRAVAGGAIGLTVLLLLWDLWPVVIPLGIFAGGAAVVFLGKLEPAQTRHLREQTLDVLPEALDLLGACIRAGQPLRIAVSTVANVLGAPLEDQLRRVLHGISVGMSDEQAWLVLADDPVMGAVARDIARSAVWGTTMVDVLSQHSRQCRQQRSRQRLKAVKKVGVSSVVPLGVCYLPAFILLGVVPVIAAGVSGVFS